MSRESTVGSQKSVVVASRRRGNLNDAPCVMGDESGVESRQSLVGSQGLCEHGFGGALDS